MSSELVCIGPTHETASLAARERFALTRDATRELAAELLADPDVLEVVGLTTCNRTELYVHATSAARASEAILVGLGRVAGVGAAELHALTSTWTGSEAVRHLFRVASGLESVVLGEAEIMQQLKSALRNAHDDRACGPFLDRLFRQALETGKAVRTRTDISRGNASIGSVAGDIVEQRLGSLDGRRVLVVGAGEMGVVAVRSLTARGARNVVISNRNRERALQLAERYGGRVAPLSGLVEEITAADVVICATAAPHFMLSRDEVACALAGRDGHGLIVVDLAIPRDVAPEVAELPGVSVLDLDDIQRRVANDLARRRQAAAAAEGIVEGAVAEFASWRHSLEVVPAIRSLRSRAETIRSREIDRFDARLAHLAPEDRQAIDQLTRGIINKLLHQPTVRLRERSVEPDSGIVREVTFAGAVRELFALDTSPGA